jgi:hypothetical protein
LQPTNISAAARISDLELARRACTARHGDARLIAGSKRILAARAIRDTSPR